MYDGGTCFEAPLSASASAAQPADVAGAWGVRGRGLSFPLNAAGWYRTMELGHEHETLCA